MTNKQASGIVLLGLGPGGADLLTRQAWDWLQGCTELYVRTLQHPTLAGLPSTLQIVSFDDVYDTSDQFEQVYARIVARVLELGQRPQGVTYAVPGHPFVAEATAPEIARRAKEMNLPVRVIEGVSFLEPTLSALGIDIFPRVQMVDALDLANLHTPLFPPDQPALVAQIYSREVAADVKLTLNTVYPDTHAVRLVHAAGTPQEIVEDLALYEIDRSSRLGLLSTLYVPPLAANTSVENLQEVIAHLRAPEGCPWDKEQTQHSLGPSLLEETYEALAALEQGDPDGFREELGDVLMLLVMLSQIASEDGDFTFAEVVQGITTKMIRRHPHVFGDVRVDDAAGVLRNWENLKDAERKGKGKEGEQQKGILDGLPKNLPALMLAQKYQDRAAHVGFDWPDVAGVKDKILEEWQEVLDAQTAEDTEAELGDLLFAVVNLIRWNKADAESVLRKANLRFRTRFGHIEQSARTQARPLTELTLDEMEALWQEAKHL